jgi:hemerythrin superfamily protein
MQLNDINGLDTLNANNIHCDSLYSDNIELNGFDLETKLDNIEDKTDYLTVSNNHLSTITFEADYVNATEINADDIFTQGHNVGEDLEDAQNRLNELENKTQYITYADADYTNMRGTLDISGSIEADSAIIDVLATDSIELAGEDLDTTLTGITNKISPLSTGINDNRSYMRIMTDDVEVSNLSVADTTVTDYLEVLGGEMTLGSIVINDENAWFKVE